MVLEQIFADIRACTLCAEHLPLGPRPVVRGSVTSRLLIIGQAPGTKVHESGIPWNDASGERLRDWMGLSPDQFYDERNIAIMPMGFCYPGTQGQNLGGGAGNESSASNGGNTKQGGGAGEVLKRDGGKKNKADQAPKRDGGSKKASGDAPPRPECAPLWHDKMLRHLPNIQLTLLVGQYAHKYYLGKQRAKTLTETVARHADYAEQGVIPLPHPSWRVVGWSRKNPWFETDVLPELKRAVSACF